MDKYDLLEAMGEIRDRYIEEAALPFTAAPEQTSAEPASTSQVTGTNHQIKAAAAGRKRKKLLLWSTSVAALLCVSIILLSLPCKWLQTVDPQIQVFLRWDPKIRK